METYDEIYTRMKEKYEAESGYEIDPASDVAIRLRVLAGEIYNAQCSTEWLKRQMFADTATGVYLDYIASQRGLSRKAATKATGRLTFSVNEPVDYAIEIPAGTVVATNGEVPVRVYTTESVVLPQATYSVTADAEAEQPGYNGNIAAGTAEVPVSVPAGIDNVTNTVFIGGDDEESDKSLRARVKESFVYRPNSANIEFYKRLALSVDGVDKVGIIERYTGPGILGVFIARKDNDVTDETLSEVHDLIMYNRTVGIMISVNRAVHFNYDLHVYARPKPGYEEAEVVEKITDAFVEFIGLLDIGENLYLTNLSQALFETGCLETFHFDSSMQNITGSGSTFFRPGDVTVEVV